ncbi:nucleotidyltransferase domain-containing protein [Candidatus Woesearchaeota archaeon]|nr:nucleotidyltransferase domain-containing protein [Candidatus Woesearchaeota archaeon]
MIQNYNGYRILELFLHNSTELFRLREISRKLNLGLPSVIRYVKQLEGEQLIIKKKIHSNFFYLANRENQRYKVYKITDSLMQLEKSGLIAYLEQQLNYPTIVLFGSHAIGEDTEKSDYDIALFTETKKGLDLDLQRFEQQFGAPIQLFVYDKKGVNQLKKKNKELLNSIINGIIVRGMVKVF